MKAPVIYVKDLIAPQLADSLFYKLWNQLLWIQHDKVPRREYYVNDHNVPYSYGVEPFARTYQPQPNTLEIGYIRFCVQEYLLDNLGKDYNMDVCFLNGYKDGQDQLGWHSDDSPEMDDERPIVTVSLGAEREIWFRKIPQPFLSSLNSGLARGEISTVIASTGVEKLRLGNGSMAIMLPHMQDTHQHRIPKSDRPCGPRISLTFRGYVKGE
jgi:alkylated DNA repair dioxygenase AlkB